MPTLRWQPIVTLLLSLFGFGVSKPGRRIVIKTVCKDVSR